MSFWQQILHTLGFVRLPRQSFHIEADLLQSLQALAELEQRPQDEVAADLLAFALAQRDLQEDNLRRWQELSPREQQVVALVCLDYTNRQIAARLVISPDTVKSHIRNALRKFNLNSKADLRAALSNWDWSAWQNARL